MIIFADSSSTAKINFSKPKRFNNTTRFTKSCIKRSDMYGNAIQKGKKKHKITFRDNID